MRINNWSILYTLGYGIVATGVKAFYKRNQTVGQKNIPRDKPVIFAANHQNAFMDPVVIAVELWQPTYYLVRADVFKKPIVAKIFDSINMMPIYRERDGVNTKTANDEVFNRCYDILAKNRPIIIFPEGNHGKFKELRSLKKGFARIGVGAEEKHGHEIDVQIVPVGLNYSDHTNMGAEMLVKFGEPIDLSEYVESSDDAKGINELRAVLADRMSDLLIDIQTKEYYQTIHEFMFIFDNEIQTIYNKDYDGSLEQKFLGQKEFISKAESYFSQNPNGEIEERVVAFKNEVSKQGLHYWLFRKEKHNIVGSALALTLLAPTHLYGLINNYLPYKIPVWFIKKNIKDPQFHSSMKMALGVVFFFLFWLIQSILFAVFYDGVLVWSYIISLPLSAWISYHYWIRTLKTRGQMKYNKLSKLKNQGITNLKEEYQELKELFVKITR